MRGALLTAISIVLAGGLSGSLFAGGVAEQIHHGVQAYQQHNFKAAAGAFESALKREPASPESAFDLGTAEYRDGNYSQALKSFQQAEAANTAPQELQARASYDQGKSLAKLGDAQVVKDPRGAVQDYKKGVEAFRRTLQVDPSMKKAGYNIEVLRRRIKKLEQKLKQQPPPEGKPGSNGSTTKRQSPKTARKAASRAGSRTNKGGKAPEKGAKKNGGARTGSQSAKPVTNGQQAGSGIQTTARQILSAEKDHRRIINLQSQQVSPRVAQNW